MCYEKHGASSSRDDPLKNSRVAVDSIAGFNAWIQIVLFFPYLKRTRRSEHFYPVKKRVSGKIFQSLAMTL
jgi:hypothetical protein